MRVLKMGIGVLALTSVAMGCTGGSSSGSSSGTSGNNNNTSSSSSTGGGSSMGGGSSGIIGSSGGGNSSRMQSSGGGGSSSGGQVSSNPIIERMACVPDQASSGAGSSTMGSSSVGTSSSAPGSSSVGSSSAPGSSSMGSSSSGAPCADDALPAHYSPAEAHVVALTANAATLMDMVSCPANEDWYKVAVPAGAGLRVDMAFMDATSDLDLYVSAESAPTDYLDSSVGTTDTEEAEVSYTAAAANFLVRVRNFGAMRNTYTINFTVVPGGICTEDTNEPNNDVASATDLTRIGEFGTACAADPDYYALPALGGAGTATVHVDVDVPAGLEARIETTGGAMVTSTRTDRADGFDVAFAATAATPYFVRLANTGGAGVSAYDVTFSSPPPANDTCATATALTPTASGIMVSGSTIDADRTLSLATTCTRYTTLAGDVFYTVTVGPNQLLTVRLSAPNEDMSLYLVDSCESRCCWAGVDIGAGGDGEVLQYRNITAAAQTLFLGVDGYSVNDEDDFTMEVLLQ